ncbi:50S ribosomal protein L3 [Buchnera aphidicola]|uniref:Large ribosomal subunit protein uL3 n=1 Tax=Buchnera aphidicola subsp. Tuberolachnus salignus TaxID=98804 RepID=A0A160SZ43_BUCTT|nr:50S ribosomal protein L3 [Buchnera aphidicola]CUR53321.1 50S ribosomal protein L3 [Buchnera aphidicola (Tuberolachnus salignus)]
MVGLIGKKIGMTRLFTIEGLSIPATVIEIKKNIITCIKTVQKNLYNSIQVTTGIKKIQQIKKPEAGHFLKLGIRVGSGLWEFKCSDIHKFYCGQKLSVSFFSKIKKVDITGISKGKGFSGTVKRWNFSMQDATHGNSLSHRVPGSIGQNQTPGRVFKGKKMAGHLGNSRVTIQSLKIIKIDESKNLLFIKGGVPGCTGGYLKIRPSIKV